MISSEQALRPFTREPIPDPVSVQIRGTTLVLSRSELAVDIKAIETSAKRSGIRFGQVDTELNLSPDHVAARMQIVGDYWKYILAIR